jgi:hypothetical protein
VQAEHRRAERRRHIHGVQAKRAELAGKHGGRS